MAKTRDVAKVPLDRAAHHAAMKRPVQSPSTIEKAQRWADRWVAMNQEIFMTEEAAYAEYASLYFQLPQLKDVFDRLEAKMTDRDRSNHFCELGAQYLERGEMPPEPLRKFLVKILRAAMKTRGYFVGNRNAQIIMMIEHLEKLGFPLFPNRDAAREGQTYGRDIAIKAFKNAGLSISPATVEKVWNNHVRTFGISKKVRMK